VFGRLLSLLVVASVQRVVSCELDDCRGYLGKAVGEITGGAQPIPVDAVTLFGRLAELAEYIDGDAIDEAVDRCPSTVQ